MQPELSVDWAQSYKNQSSRFSFLDLPRELRDNIYRYAFRVHGAIMIYTPYPFSLYVKAKAMIVRHGKEGPFEPVPIGNTVPVSLMLTCKQLHAECSPVLYGSNVFRVWSLGDRETALVYRQLMKSIIFNTDVYKRICKPDLNEVALEWKHRFWPAVIRNGSKMLDRYPACESLVLPLAQPEYGSSWTPAFFAKGKKTKEERIAFAVEWLLSYCPLKDDRLRSCLQVELAAPSLLSKDVVDGSRVASTLR